MPDDFTAELLLMPNKPGKRPKNLAATLLKRNPDGHGSMSFTEFREKQRSLAMETTVLSEDLLRGEWYARQLDFQSEKVATIMAAMDGALNGPHPLLNSKDPRWPAYWLADARYRYADRGLAKLKAQGHVLCCPVNGLPGVTAAEWADAMGRAVPREGPSRWYESLSLRGRLDDPPYDTTWYWMSEKASQGRLEDEGKRLWERHRDDRPLHPDDEAKIAGLRHGR